MIILKRNNLLNLCLLFLILLTLFLFDKTKLNKYIGYKKVKEFVLVDYNIMPFAKKFFGDNFYDLYNEEINVSNSIIDEIKIDDYILVYVSEQVLYSTYIGSVSNIVKHNDLYDVYLNLSDEKIVFYNLIYTELKLYQKVETNTVLGYLPYSKEGYYYYYQKY